MPHKLVAKLLQPALPSVGARAAAHAEAIAERRCGRGVGVGKLLQQQQVTSRQRGLQDAGKPGDGEKPKEGAAQKLSRRPV